MKKNTSLLLIIMCGLTLLGACGTKANHGSSQSTNSNGAIAVVSREEGSGARSAFEELVNVNTELGVNHMTADAIIQNGNGVIATFVADNTAAIGYISFATFIDRGDDLVGVSIDGVAPTTENMLSGTYGLIRPFNFVYLPEDIGMVEQAFMTFVASTDGLQILADLGAVVNTTVAEPFDMSTWDLPPTTVSFGGSTSTETTATALMDEFMAMFPQIEITYESVGSGAGITGAQEGTFSLGFASREIHDSELETGLNYITYCVDGLVIVVNSTNTVSDLTTEQIRNIYRGRIDDWSQVQ